MQQCNEPQQIQVFTEPKKVQGCSRLDTVKTGEYEIDGLQDWSVRRTLYNTVVPEVGARVIFSLA